MILLLISLTLLHSERPELCGVLASLSAVGLNRPNLSFSTVSFLNCVCDIYYNVYYNEKRWEDVAIQKTDLQHGPTFSYRV